MTRTERDPWFKRLPSKDEIIERHALDPDTQIIVYCLKEDHVLYTATDVNATTLEIAYDTQNKHSRTHRVGIFGLEHCNIPIEDKFEMILLGKISKAMLDAGMPTLVVPPQFGGYDERSLKQSPTDPLFLIASQAFSARIKKLKGR